MDANSLKKLKGKIYLYVPLTFILLAAIFMLSAGSLNYWQAWLFCAVIFIPVLFISVYFFKRSPEFLERRLKFREKEPEQKAIIGIADLFFFF